MQQYCASRFIRFPNVISLLIIEQFSIYVNKQKKPSHHRETLSYQHIEESFQAGSNR
ncbi:hypothetical protein [Bacillus sp. WP8]|uniref:hypothetical protein n=1 Tax=Bacillus sp. WP8 TaxID=756828 RepID=UPI001642A008|nr:hypothetical protein [Bacillus sp. WP8]